uniref:Acid phosphatase n=1 Tax=viral metagenome TaxID=1070528 RepID=A0A6C0EM03_9ZZZZ
MEKVASEILHTIDTLWFPQNAVIVYDIDNTLIDLSGRPLTPIIQTYHYAKSKGIDTMIVTARLGTEKNIITTRRQLAQYGINEYLGIYFRPPTNKGDAEGQTQFKLKSRKNIHDRGHLVVMSIGDMPWDIGQFGGFGFQVPS